MVFELFDYCGCFTSCYWFDVYVVLISLFSAVLFCGLPIFRIFVLYLVVWFVWLVSVVCGLMLWFAALAWLLSICFDYGCSVFLVGCFLCLCLFNCLFWVVIYACFFGSVVCLLVWFIGCLWYCVVDWLFCFVVGFMVGLWLWLLFVG